ncbi:MAG: 6-phosphofructokinase [Catonella sp.]|uniref:6-phosphofructokinase n=1 Tax=Catonella sp. TaxID=2382125 RepID=UPI003FA14374
MKNLIVAQSGGPTAAINATLSGVIKEWLSKKKNNGAKVYGAKFGVEGILKENIIDLGELSEDDLDKLMRTPSSALGSCRYRLADPKKDETDFKRVLEVFRKYDIGHFVYIGGNDSMDTVYRLSEYFNEQGITDITVNGAPKTIDNDLNGIDHCPGFGSTAKYIATVCSELAREVRVYDKENILIVEIMGRNAGWLTAAAALAAEKDEEVPYLIYLSEVKLSVDKFVADLREVMKKSKNVIVALSEGTVIETAGRADSNSEVDAFGHKQLGGNGRILEKVLKDELKYKARYIELSLIQRCASHCMSETDIMESVELGRVAVRLGLEGKSGRMARLTRISDEPYKIEYSSVDIKEVANLEKKVPLEWINEGENGVTEEMLRYLRPLVKGEMSCRYKDGVPEFFVI